MSEILFLKFLHIIGLVYWLGGDLGVFYSSFVVANTAAPASVRVSAAKMLFALDQAPRMCMTMMLPLGAHLAWRLGVLPITSGAIVAIWIIAFLWLASVLFLHFGASAAAKSIVTKIDYIYRLVVISILVGTGVTALLDDTLLIPYWVAWKLILFGTMIALGLLVRIVLKEFGPAFGKLVADNASDEDNAAILRSLGRTRPFVICIWIGLLLSAALGLHLI